MCAVILHMYSVYTMFYVACIYIYIHVCILLLFVGGISSRVSLVDESSLQNGLRGVCQRLSSRSLPVLLRAMGIHTWSEETPLIKLGYLQLQFL